MTLYENNGPSGYRALVESSKQWSALSIVSLIIAAFVVVDVNVDIFFEVDVGIVVANMKWRQRPCQLTSTSLSMSDVQSPSTLTLTSQSTTLS